MNNLRIFCFLLILNSQFLILNSFAQSDPPLRLELECEKDQQDYHFYSINNQGVAVFYRSALVSVDTMQWIFIHYDTNLVRKEIHRIKLPNHCQYFAADFSKEKLYLYFHKPAQKKDTLINYLLECDFLNKEFQLFDLQNHKNPYLTSMKVRDDYLFLVIDEQKSKTIVHYNYKTNRKLTTQYIEDEITSIESFAIDTLAKTTSFCMFLKNRQGSRAELFTTDYSGNLRRQAVFPYYSELVYNSAIISVVGKDSLLLVGGYSQSKDKKQSGCFSGVYALFFAHNRFSEIKTNHFGALLAKDSVFNARYLAESNITMNLHVKQHNHRIFAITEVFYPEYQYTTYSPSYRHYGYYGYDPPTRLFAGFRFLNAYIFEYDKQGLLTEQWYLPIQNMLTQSFYNVVNLYQDPEGNSLFYYVRDNVIVSQFMHGQHVLEPQAAMPVEQSYKNDVVEYSSNISMRHWYDNNFLLSGYQYIKSSQRGKKRYVFFLNKMICE